jgi:hypothetical protein
MPWECAHAVGTAAFLDMPQVRGNLRYEKGNATDQRYNGGRRKLCARQNGASVRHYAIA